MDAREQVRGSRSGRAGARRVARRTLVCASVAVFAAGCVGSVEREEFEELVQARGGGLSGDLLVDLVEAIHVDAGVDEVGVLRMTLTSTSAHASVRSVRFDDEVDGYRMQLDRAFSGPDPESDEGPVPAFPSGSIDADAIEASIDRAVDETGVRDGWASSAIVRAVAGDTFVVLVSITNERDDETFVFDAAGALLEVQS